MAKKENPKLVQIAVQFLLNPTTEKTPDDTKRAFLKKKGIFPPENLIFLINSNRID